ncbi:hypothetical protein ACJJTC_005869 [Scirpophaga incertulas]
MISASSETDRMASKEYYVKRSSIKSQLTKFKNYLFIVTQKGELTTLKLAELALKLGKLETLSLKFDDLQCEIEVLNSDNLQRELDVLATVDVKGNAYLERYPLPPVFKTIGACARHPSLPRFGHAAPVEIHTLTRSLCRSTASDSIFRRL